MIMAMYDENWPSVSDVVFVTTSPDNLEYDVWMSGYRQLCSDQRIAFRQEFVKFYQYVVTLYRQYASKRAHFTWWNFPATPPIWRSSARST